MTKITLPNNSTFVSDEKFSLTISKKENRSSTNPNCPEKRVQKLIKENFNAIIQRGFLFNDRNYKFNPVTNQIEVSNLHGTFLGGFNPTYEAFLSWI